MNWIDMLIIVIISFAIYIPAYYQHIKEEIENL